MTRRNDEEREMLRNPGECASQLASRSDERFVAPAREARARYIEFAAQASKLCKGEHPIGFKGDPWRL